jgi:hypothetical protein
MLRREVTALTGHYNRHEKYEASIQYNIFKGYRLLSLIISIKASILVTI